MLINTLEQLEAIKPSLLACVDPCVDTETDGLNTFGTKFIDPNKMAGISIDDGREAYYFPFRHAQGINLPFECLDFFRVYLSNPDRTFGGFNYKFDQHVTYGDGVEFAPNYEDAMLGVQLLNENEINFKLKELCDRYGIGDGSLQESILKDKVLEACKSLGIFVSEAKSNVDNWKSKMWVLDPADVEPYACDDVRLTRGLLDLVKPALRYHGLYDIWKQVNYYSFIIGKMEQRGMLLDVDKILQYQAEAEGHIKDAFSRLHKSAGYELNPNSSKQVCSYLDTTSSAAEVLVELMDDGGEIADKAKLIQEARGWSSVNSRYYVPYLESIDNDNVLHCSLNLMGTISGRLSCSKPNLQAVARHTDIFKVKDVFIARPGYTLIQADYKQAEMRLVTFYTKDKIMLDMIESGADLHSATAETLGIPRNAAKRLNFSVVYGIGAEALSTGLRISKNLAQQYLSKYHGLYPGFRKLMKACEQIAETDGAIRMWTGRMRHFNVKEAYTHKAMSNLVQGGVAEVVRVAISKLYPAMRDLGGYMLLQVHDSIMFEVPDENVQTALPVIKSIMEDFEFRPAMGVDIEFGKSWGTLEKWTPPQEIARDISPLPVSPDGGMQVGVQPDPLKDITCEARGDI